jgi:hypothetical protein
MEEKILNDTNIFYKHEETMTGALFNDCEVEGGIENWKQYTMKKLKENDLCPIIEHMQTVDILNIMLIDSIKYQYYMLIKMILKKMFILGYKELLKNKLIVNIEKNILITKSILLLNWSLTDMMEFFNRFYKMGNVNMIKFLYYKKIADMDDILYLNKKFKKQWVVTNKKEMKKYKKKVSKNMSVLLSNCEYGPFQYILKYLPYEYIISKAKLSLGVYRGMVSFFKNNIKCISYSDINATEKEKMIIDLIEKYMGLSEDKDFLLIKNEGKKCKISQRYITLYELPIFEKEEDKLLQMKFVSNIYLFKKFHGVIKKLELLYWSCFYMVNMEKVDYLSKHLNIDKRDYENVFLDLCDKGRFKQIQLMVENKKINPSIKNNIAIKLAGKNGHVKIVHYLYFQVKNIKDQQKIIDDIMEHSNIFQMFVDKFYKNKEKMSIWLYSSMQKKKPICAKIILEKTKNQVNINWKIFASACENEHKYVIKLLLQNPTLKLEEWNQKTIDLLIKKKDCEFLEWLLDQKNFILTVTLKFVQYLVKVAKWNILFILIRDRKKMKMEKVHFQCLYSAGCISNEYDVGIGLFKKLLPIQKPKIEHVYLCMDVKNITGMQFFLKHKLCEWKHCFAYCIEKGYLLMIKWLLENGELKIRKDYILKAVMDHKDGKKYEWIVIFLINEKIIPASYKKNMLFKWASGCKMENMITYLLNNTNVWNTLDKKTYRWDILKFAIKTQNPDIITYILKQKLIPPNVEDNYLIQWSSRYGFVRLLTYLLKQKDVTPGANKNEAFYLAAKWGQFQIVKLLIKDKRVNVFDMEFRAFYAAKKYHHIDIVKFLLSYVGDDKKPLFDINNEKTYERRTSMNIMKNILPSTFSSNSTSSLLLPQESVWQAHRGGVKK